MALPNVSIKLTNGALGAIGDSQDNIAGLVLTGTAVGSGIDLMEPKAIYSLQDAEALGILEEGTNAFAHKQIKEFYKGYQHNTGRELSELYIILVSDLTSLEAMVDTEAVSTLLDFAQGRIRLLGLSRNPASGYDWEHANAVDEDVIDVIPKLQTVLDTYAGTDKQSPLRGFVGGFAFVNTEYANLPDLKTQESNRVAVVAWGTDDSNVAALGFTLGFKASLPVQRKVSRVKNGSIRQEVFTPGTDELIMSVSEQMHNKGYITMRTYPGRVGYYFTGEPTATADTDDYAILSRGCIVDKAQRLAYDVFLEELEDDIEVDENGQLLAGYKAYLENRVVRRLEAEMAGAISGTPEFYILDNQNILSDSTTRCQLAIVPVGYQSKIEVDLGFKNPALD